MWQRARSVSKTGFDRAWGWADKLGAPVNNLSNKLGSEAFWPTALDKECDKAARILRSFCKDGFRATEDEPVERATSADGKPNGIPRKNHTKVLKKIPPEVIQNAKGIAIFTTMRTGLWFSGAGGSGVLMARLPNGQWSCPSGILLHTAGLGFLVGVDIYDCVMVLNTTEAVEAFCKIRCTVGGELSAVAGPIGMGGVLESEVHARRAPIFTYLKSRGFYAGVQLDGTIIIERSDENERFYGRKIAVGDILAGRVSLVPADTQRLLQTVKLAQGDTDVDVSMLSIEAPPSDFDIASGQVFGLPGREDPDPYGVLALEQEGLVIREAGSQQEVSHESFQFMPSPTSPLFGAYKPGQSWGQGGHGVDSGRSSWRTSLTDKSAGSPRLPSTSQAESSPQTSSRPHSATIASKMAGIPEVDSIDQAISTADLVSPSTNQESKTGQSQTPRAADDASETPTTGSTPQQQPQKRIPPPLPPRDVNDEIKITTNGPPPEMQQKRKPGPALPPRPLTAASRILQEQLALAGQLRELISPTNSENNTSTPNTPVLPAFKGATKPGSPHLPTIEVQHLPEATIPVPVAVSRHENPSEELTSSKELTAKTLDSAISIAVVHEAVAGKELKAEEMSDHGTKSNASVHDTEAKDAAHTEKSDVDAPSSAPVANNTINEPHAPREAEQAVIAKRASKHGVDDEDSDWSSEEGEVVFHEVVTAAAPRAVTASPQLISKARIVNVTMPSTPALPSRNPNRVRRGVLERTTSEEDGATSADAQSDADDSLTPDEHRPRSRASSIYSAKEEVLSSTKGSDSLASVSSADNAEANGDAGNTKLEHREGFFSGLKPAA